MIVLSRCGSRRGSSTHKVNCLDGVRVYRGGDVHRKCQGRGLFNIVHYKSPTRPCFCSLLLRLPGKESGCSGVFWSVQVCLTHGDASSVDIFRVQAEHRGILRQDMYQTRFLCYEYTSWEVVVLKEESAQCAKRARGSGTAPQL